MTRAHTLITTTSIEQPDGTSVEVQVTYEYYAGRPQRLNEPAEHPDVTIVAVEPEVGEDHHDALTAACWDDLAERAA